MTTPDYVAGNQRAWDALAPGYAATGRRLWAAQEPSWGIWGVQESELGLLADVEGGDALELGCGTGYVSAWLARRGARPVGLDPSWRQLETARACQREFDLHFPLVCAIAEAVPLPAASFDLVVSEYGAAIWSDPYRWIPEAARVLRPGGELIFLGNASLLTLCVQDDENEPATDRLLRPQRGMHRFEWPDSDEVEFHLSHGDWIALLREHGFDVLALHELYPPADATSGAGFVDHAWASRWPSEEVWRARRRP
ncbi:class I SAM-dependent methyltransferase [Nitriliruptor alkaliphilus]|uniref:class I SAM-dependent methyltransferase n=1 Tax=Nitriliruptor alkaliphilus TaxID=427918 RepID=UPI00069658CF|nr:class I SAM-dependent methyltransferase [Nitriliruptor alkaliphilus]